MASVSVESADVDHWRAEGWLQNGKFEFRAVRKSESSVLVGLGDSGRRVGQWLVIAQFFLHIL